MYLSQVNRKVFILDVADLAEKKTDLNDKVVFIIKETLCEICF